MLEVRQVFSGIYGRGAGSVFVGGRAEGWGMRTLTSLPRAVAFVCFVQGCAEGVRYGGGEDYKEEGDAGKAVWALHSVDRGIRFLVSRKSKFDRFVQRRYASSTSKIQHRKFLEHHTATTGVFFSGSTRRGVEITSAVAIPQRSAVV